MDENPRIKAEEGRSRQKQGSQKRANFSQPSAQEERQQDDQGTAQHRNSTQSQDFQITKRFFPSQPRAPVGDPGESRPMKVRCVEGIPPAFQSFGRDFRPDRLVSMQRGLGQIQKPQTCSHEKNSSPNQAANRRRHPISLWCLAEIVKVLESSSSPNPVSPMVKPMV